MGEPSMSEHPEILDLLGPQEEREAEEHLQGCAKCREEARDLRPVHDAWWTSRTPHRHRRRS